MSQEKGERKLNREELAALFGKEEWDGPITLLTRVVLAKQLGVSERTLRRWEQQGIINRPLNAIQGAGRGNLAVYRDPLEGVVQILSKGNDVYIKYINGKIRWRKRRPKIKETKTIGDINGLV